MMVSIKVPVMETRPCSAAHLVLAAAATIGAEPKPDSLENTPRATPLRIASMTVAPKKPPWAAVGVKASCSTIPIAPGILSAKQTKMPTVVMKYSTAIAGTILEATLAMDLRPPMVTAATTTVRAIPVYITGIPAVIWVISTMEFT